MIEMNRDNTDAVLVVSKYGDLLATKCIKPRT